MDYVRATQEFRPEHRHGDGNSWPMRPIHDPAEADHERSWLKGTIFRCTKCDESIVVADSVDDEGAHGRG
jgi:hypothetical protein